ncbi:MAG: hypothetical protein N3A69_17865, partial [Leptospiraceae bacterium]|nr:hypothetical protein [Leptospiraceae bacterium]
MLEVEVVGSSRDRVLYIVFKNDEEIVPNSLYRLQHPGMLTVERWNSAMFKQSGEDIKVDTATRTKNFFKECV